VFGSSFGLHEIQVVFPLVGLAEGATFCCYDAPSAVHGRCKVHRTCRIILSGFCCDFSWFFEACTPSCGHQLTMAITCLLYSTPCFVYVLLLFVFLLCLLLVLSVFSSVLVVSVAATN
ncbi:unnamed protein product, partial [Scytosiphon promiscuus]